MGKDEKKRYKFGLIGKNISYSFSKRYFGQKFIDLGLADHSYENFDLASIEEFASLLQKNKELSGLNVTIPYKEEILPYLDRIHGKAKKIGAVNTIKFTKKGLKGYNTDAYGFKKAIKPHLKKHHRKALILGSGGASKAVIFSFRQLGIGTQTVSRNPKQDQLGYKELGEALLWEHSIIVNCTPLGTFPRISEKPDIPYHMIQKEHLLFDLIYNPQKTAFLAEGERLGARTLNGLKMLEYQAEKAWRIWTS